jgi:DNA polymerase epsilon subunit 2
VAPRATRVEHDAVTTTVVCLQMVRTILDQGHLSPITLAMQPVYWEYDYSLRLTVQPNAIVIGEDRDPYVFKYADTLAMNPGTFSGETPFIVYRPGRQAAEKSYINAPEDE